MDKLTVKQARKIADLSITEMAKRLGLSSNGYLYKEQGKRRFYVDEAIKFSKAVGIPIENILFY